MSKILLVFSSGALGGAERSLSRMALTAGDHYHLATLDGEGHWSEWIRGFGIEPLVFGQRDSGIAHGKFGVQAIYRAANWVRRNRVETVYVCGLRAASAMRLVRGMLGNAMLVEGVRWNPCSSGKVDRAFRFVERRFGGLVDGYIANSAVTVETLVRDCRTPVDKTAVAYNGIDLPQTELFSWEQREPIVVTVANYSPRKGYLEYLDVVREVLRHYPGARFLLIGRDDMNGVLEREIQRRGLDSNVSCLGFCADVSSILARARVFVLPSLWGEGCPTAILEAMAYYTPVAAYRLDGIPELVEHGIDGLLAPLGNSHELAQDILKLLSSPQMAMDMGRAGAAKIRARFTVRECVAQHEAAFEKIQRYRNRK